MACFLVPVAEAVMTTAISAIMKSKEKKENASVKKDGDSEPRVNPFRKKLNWLSTMLWGGSALLAFEHLWHGEIVPWFPFLTAAENAEDAAEMLHEMSTVGVSMAILVTAVWAGAVAVTSIIEKKAEKKEIPSAEKN